MKKILVVLLVALMCFNIIAQGQTEKPVDIVIKEDFVGNKNAETIITVAMGIDDTLASTIPVRRALAEKVFTKWANEHPNYAAEIKLVDTSNIAVTMSKYLTEAEMGAAPDLLYVDSYYVGTFKEAGVLQPINKFYSDDELNQWFEWTKDVTCIGDKQYAIWGETDARLLYYRTDLIPTPPRTWAETIEIGSRLHKELGINGFCSPTGQSEGASNEGTWAYFWAQDGEIFGENNRPILGEGDNRQKLINVYQFWADLIKSGAAPIEVASWTNGLPILSEVASNNVAMLIGGTWTLGQLASNAPDPSVWDYTYFPQREADMYSNSCGGWCWTILTEDAKKQEAAASLLKTKISDKDAMAARCKAFGYLPTRYDVYETEEFKTNETIQRFKKQFEIGHARPASSLYPAVSDINSKMLGKVLVGQLTPEQAVDQLQIDCLKEWESWKKNQ